MNYTNPTLLSHRNCHFTFSNSIHRGRYNWVDRGVEGDYSGDDDVYDEFHGGIERHSGYREVAYDPLFDDVGGES